MDTEYLDTEYLDTCMFEFMDTQTTAYLDTYMFIKKYPILEKGSAVLLLRQAQGTPLKSETGWTAELWSKINLLNWQN